MDAYFANREVQIAIPLADGVSAAGLAFEVRDAMSAIVHEGSVISSEGAALCMVPAEANLVRPGRTTDYRQLTMFSLVSPADNPVNVDYLIRELDALRPGVNSAGTYGDSMLAASELADINHFMMATTAEREAALANGYINLSSLRFSVDCLRNFSLTRLKVEQFNALPSHFIRQLQLAQVVEANEAMNPASIQKKRLSGLMSETIGESSMMFRPGRVLNLPVTRRSMMLLRDYVSWEIGIGRA